MTPMAKRNFYRGVVECAFEGCTNPATARHLCDTHYNQKYRKGRELTAVRPKKKPRRGRYLPDGRIVCVRCETARPAEEYHWKSRKENRRRTTCRFCTKDEHHESKHGKGSRQWMKEQLERQGGRCALCLTEEPGGNGWQLDHDHAKTGPESWRMVLCFICNITLGHIEKSGWEVGAFLSGLRARGLYGTHLSAIPPKRKAA